TSQPHQGKNGSIGPCNWIINLPHKKLKAVMGLKPVKNPGLFCQLPDHPMASRLENQFEGGGKGPTSLPSKDSHKGLPKEFKRLRRPPKPVCLLTHGSNVSLVVFLFGGHEGHRGHLLMAKELKEQIFAPLEIADQPFQKG